MNATLNARLARRAENAERNRAEFAAALAKNKTDIASLLDHLGQLVEAEGEGQTGTHWGRVGSLAYVRERLIEAVQHMAGLEREDVETALNDIRD